MRKLTIVAALLLAGAAAAHAQLPNGNSGNDPLREAQRTGDPAKTEEALIIANRTRNGRFEREADAARRAMPKTFKAEVEVTNRAAKAIKSVLWTATLLDPDTGNVIRIYDVTTAARIAPGSTKKLSKYLRTPRADVVKANSLAPRRPVVADLKVKVKGITYADGSTSTTP